MRRWLPLLLLFLPITGFSQSILHISPQQCVWRPGDNPAWAAPSLDESGWKPINLWKPSANQPRMWMRCHANLTSMRSAAHPALQVNADGAFQLYFNGKLAGQFGDVQSGHYTLHTVGTYPISLANPAQRDNTIAVRLAFRAFDFSTSSPPTITAGEKGWLIDHRHGYILQRALNALPQFIGFTVIGVIGFLLLGLYQNDRSRLDLLLLALLCEGLWIESLIHYWFPEPDRVFWLFNIVGNPLMIIPLTWFPFLIANRRMPLACKLLLAGELILEAYLSLSAAFFPLRAIPWQSGLLVGGGVVLQAVLTLLSVAPFVAFLPWKKIPERMRPVAVCTTFFAPIWILWWGSELWAAINPAGLAFLFQWNEAILDFRVGITLAVILMLMALLFRDQRRTASEHAALAGELLAAQEIQRMLVPTNAATTPAIQLGVAFEPMREVGGDFYQCSVLPDDTQRILIGDVSGKGAAAAMIASLLIGASKGRPDDSPSALLQHLNQALVESEISGFVTCLCAHISPNGTLTVANAGHLQPYRNGEEIPLDGALPLGITEAAEYTQSTLQLNPGDQLTLLSDGVIEAQSSTGELFGFDRTAAISTQSAEAIAKAAQAHGQEDDITVLTLTYAGSAVPAL